MARTDLTANFITAMSANGRAPRQLAVFNFPSAGAVYLSDQQLGTADGLSNEYEALIVDWGTLKDMAGGDPSKEKASEVRQLSLTIWNGGTSPFSDYFLHEQPENVVVEVYQWFEGLGEIDKALIDLFVVQDPIEFFEVNALLTLDLVSLSMKFDNPVGGIITPEDWPLAMDSVFGKSIPLIVGSPGEVTTLPVKVPAEASLDGSILSNSLTVAVKEDLDELDFPASGQLQIGEEFLRYSSRTDSSFTIVQRGWNSERSEHLDGSAILLYITDHTYLVGKGPISTINSVKVAGVAAPTSIYTTHPDTDPAIIQFSEKPYADVFSSGSTFLEMQFDTIAGSNTAFAPANAFSGETNDASLLNENNNEEFAVRQTTPTVNRGEIVKAYLAIEHWSDGNFLNDYVEVWVEGVGVVGRLSRPNPDSITDIIAEVDIDHEHMHSISGEHTHSFTDPEVAANDPKHGHGLSGVSTDTVKFPLGAIPDIILADDVFTGEYDYGVDQYKFEGLPSNWQNGVISIRTTEFNADLVKMTDKYINKNDMNAAIGEYGPAGLFKWPLVADGSTTTIGVGSSSRTDGVVWVSVMVRHTGSGSGDVTVNSLKITVTSDAGVLDSKTGVSVATVASGRNRRTTDKLQDDVTPLSTSNVEVIDTDTKTATTTSVNLFDVTEAAGFDWSWFNGRDITVTYVGTNDNRDVYLRHVWFDVEYRKRERIFSNEVTCEPAGIIDETGIYTGTVAQIIRRPDHLRKYLLADRGGLPIDFIDTVSFAEVGATYSSLDYEFNGVISGDDTVRGLEKELAFQCRSRFFWNAGKAKIALLKKTTEQSAIRSLDSADIRLRSMSAKRRKMTDITNRISLKYNRDWVDDSKEPFKSILTDQSDSSIVLNGVYEDREKWQFDLVNTDEMASDLLSYYLETKSTPSTFYTMDLYLPNFDLEKADIVSVSSTFSKLTNTNVEIKSIDRIFGSGRASRINIFRVIAENLRFIVLSVNLEDAVLASDAINVILTGDMKFDEAVLIREDILLTWERALADTQSVTDTLSLVMDFIADFSETLTVSEAPVFELQVRLSDSVTVTEDILPLFAYGYGGGGYGSVAFGGLALVTEVLGETPTITDIIGFDFDAALADTAVVSDEIGFGNAYGGALIGYGESIYGK